MSRDYFLSHSSADTPFVSKVAEALGQQNCFLDRYDVKPGDELLDRLDFGLSTAKVFVLFWSKFASKSAWVNEEIGQTRVRKILHNNVRILPIRVDDTALPLWMQRLVYLEVPTDIAIVASKIKALREEVAVEVTSEERPFQNRIKEGDAIERAYFDENIAGVLLTGLPGMGKTSLCRRFLSGSLPQLRMCWVDIAGAATPATVFGQIAHHFGLRIPVAVIEKGDWTRYWHEWIEPVFDKRNDSLVLDGFSEIIEQDGRVPPWFEEPIKSLSSNPSANCLPLVITSSKALSLDPRSEANLREIYLRRLDDHDVVRALRGMLAQGFPRRQAAEAQLRQAAAFIDGYPLGAQIWAGYALKVGVELALSDPAPAQKKVLDLVQEMLARISLNEDERSTLLLLSLSRLPLSLAPLTESLEVSKASLASLRNMLLLELTESGVLIHSLLRRYIADSAYREAVHSAHLKLAKYFKLKWQESSDEFADSAIYGSQAYFHYASAGNLSDANTIKWGLNQEASEAIKSLYRAHEDELVINLGGQLAMTLGSEVSGQVLFYLGLALSRRDADEGDRQGAISTFAELLKRFPENRYYWSGLGDVYQRFGSVEDAKKSFRHARSLSGRRDPVPSTKLGEILLREGNWKEASMFLKEAYERAPDDPRVLAAYALLLQQEGDNSKALSFVREALQKRPNDVHLNHRAGAILRGMGERTEAVSHFKRATIGRDARAAYTSLADLYLDLYRIPEAKEVMERYPGPKDAAYHNVMGNIARKEERFLDAEGHYNKAKRSEGVTVILCGSLMNLRLDQARRALDGAAAESAAAYLSDAEMEYRKGINIEPANPALLELKNHLDKLRVQAAEFMNKTH